MNRINFLHRGQSLNQYIVACSAENGKAQATTSKYYLQNVQMTAQIPRILFGRMEGKSDTVKKTPDLKVAKTPDQNNQSHLEDLLNGNMQLF